MRLYLKTSLFPLISLIIFAFPAYAGQFKVIRVYDGDTIKAIDRDIEIKVRLVGIDAPETSRKKGQPGQPFSEKAKKRLADFILNKFVEIKSYELDRYNRILGVIYLGGENINLHMIEAGLAEVYRGKPPKGFDLEPYCQAELKSMEDKKGIWSLGDDYMSPMEWRRMAKQ